MRRVGRLVFVDADDDLLAAVDRRLPPRRRFLDAQFRHAAFDRPRHAAQRLDLVDQRHRRRRDRMSQVFDVIAAAQWIDDMRDAGLLGEDQLCVARDPGRERGRQGQRLVKRIRVQRLRAAEHRGQGLDRRADDVVVRVLFGQADAGCLTVRAQREARLVLRVELLHQTRPQQSCGAQFGDLHEEIHADAEKERQARREFVDLQTAGQRRPHIFESVSEGKGQFLHRCRAGLFHMIAGNRNRVELRHMPRGVFDNVGDNAHRRCGRVDIRVANHEFLEDVILDRALEFLLRHALLLGGDDEPGQHRQYRAVHRHRHAHPVERDAVEQDLHVLDRVDRDAGLADITDDARVVAVIAAMGRQIERDRQPHLPGFEIVAIEAVRVLGRRKAGILPDRPRPVGVHRRARAAQIGRHAGDRVAPRKPGVLDFFKIGGGVERLDGNALGRAPVEARERLAAQFLRGEIGPALDCVLVACHCDLRRRGAAVFDRF